MFFLLFLNFTTYQVQVPSVANDVWSVTAFSCTYPRRLLLVILLLWEMSKLLEEKYMIKNVCVVIALF